jgi:uncharacterized protein YbaA (DUF1428 family)
MPDQMSGLMAKFFANFIPVIALLWALDSVLVYRVLYREVFYITSLVKVGPSLGCIIFVILFLVVPIRTMINNCFKNQSAMADKTYDEISDNFVTDYDIENPISKTEGIIRMMEKKLANASEEDKEVLQSQIKAAQGASVTQAFQQYSVQKSAMNSQMMQMAAPRMVVMAQPMMMPRVQMMAGGTAGGFAMAMPGVGQMGFAMAQRP